MDVFPLLKGKGVLSAHLDRGFPVTKGQKGHGNAQILQKPIEHKKLM